MKQYNVIHIGQFLPIGSFENSSDAVVPFQNHSYTVFVLFNPSN